MRTKIIILFGVFGVSFSAIFVKYANAPSTVLAFYRNLFSVLLLSPVVLIKYKDELLHLSKKQFHLCLLSGFFLACHFTCYFESVRYTSVASSTVLVDTEVIFVCIISSLLFHEKISRMGLIGIGLTFLGSTVLTISDQGAGENVLLGDALALLGSIFVCFYTMIGSRVRKDITTAVYTFITYLSTTIFLAFFTLLNDNRLLGYDVKNYFLGLLLCIFCTFAGHSVFNWGLKYLPASFISNAKLGEPVFATILAIFLFGQIPTPYQIIGGVLVISGIYTYASHINN